MIWFIKRYKITYSIGRSQCNSRQFQFNCNVIPTKNKNIIRKSEKKEGKKETIRYRFVFFFSFSLWSRQWTSHFTTCCVVSFDSLFFCSFLHYPMFFFVQLFVYARIWLAEKRISEKQFYLTSIAKKSKIIVKLSMHFERFVGFVYCCCAEQWILSFGFGNWHWLEQKFIELRNKKID